MALFIEGGFRGSRGRRQGVQTAPPLNDFTGGLNLRADAFQLEPNESPELLNVDLDPRGGFKLRGGTAAYKGAHTADLETLHYFDTTTGAAQLLASDGTNVIRWNSTVWTTVTAMSGTVRSVVFKDKMYLFNGSAVSSWDGSTATAMADPAGAGSWNNDLTAPNAGDVPFGEVAAVHMGCMFVANINENGTPRANRIRWSHPNQPEDFADYQYIDVDTGVDGDEIVALQPFGDRLLVFKRHSIHAIYGTPPESFQVFPISVEVGAVSQEAVVASDLGIYFFSWPEGVYLYTQKGITWQFESLYPAILNDDIPDAYQDEIRLGWGNSRLWVAVPYSTDGTSVTTRSHCFVLDPTLAKKGAWTLYDLPLGPFLEWKEPGADTFLIGSVVGGTQLVKVDQFGLAYDDFGAGATHIESRFRTRWVDLGDFGYTKRWKRPDIVLRRGVSATITVNGFKDFDPGHATRFFSLTSTESSSASRYGPTAQYGTAKWGSSRDDRNTVVRGAPLGNAEAVALEFVGPTTNSDWGVDAVIFKFIPRKVRG